MCHRIDVERIREDGQVGAVNREVATHIQSCKSCRASLSILAESFGIPPASAFPAYSCAACRSDMPAYIELEQRSPAAAAQAFPAAWWHFWSCPLCADTYHITHTLLDAAESGDLPPLPGSD